MIETPLRLPCGLTVPNRLAKAAMTERLAGVDGRATERHANLFKRFADGGAGLLLTGNVVVDSRCLEAPGNVFIEDEAGLEPLKRWANAGRSCGGAMIMQINHAGRQTPRSVAEVSLAPSATPLTMRKFFSTPRAMSVSEIEEAVARFAYAARVAEKAGFDGVEVHAAHGYLISQFLSPRVNKRDDAWGGDITNRARFLVRTVDAIRRAVSSSFAVGVKLNVADFIKGGLEPDDALRTVQMLDPLGLDFLELSGGTHERAVSFGFGGEAEAPDEAYFKAHAIEFRKATSIPFILTGGIHRRSTIEKLLTANVCDIVGMARPLAVEPDLPGRFIRGEADAARVITLNLPKPPRDTLADLMWRREQLVRLSEGRAPKLSLSPKLALVRMLIEESGFAKKRAKYLRRNRPFKVSAFKHRPPESAVVRPARRERQGRRGRLQ